jgi:hypothetical protein
VNSTHGLHFETATSGDGRNFSSYISRRGGENFGFIIGRGGGVGHVQGREFIAETQQDELPQSRFDALDFCQI